MDANLRLAQRALPAMSERREALRMAVPALLAAVSDRACGLTLTGLTLSDPAPALRGNTGRRSAPSVLEKKTVHGEETGASGGGKPAYCVTRKTKAHGLETGAIYKFR